MVSKKLYPYMSKTYKLVCLSLQYMKMCDQISINFEYGPKRIFSNFAIVALHICGQVIYPVHQM